MFLTTHVFWLLLLTTTHTTYIESFFYDWQSRPQDMLVQACLRVGVAQLLFMDVPEYAVLKETVDVLRMHQSIHVP
jgi:transcription termination factor NusB